MAAAWKEESMRGPPWRRAGGSPAHPSLSTRSPAATPGPCCLPAAPLPAWPSGWKGAVGQEISPFRNSTARLIVLEEASWLYFYTKASEVAACSISAGWVYQPPADCGVWIKPKFYSFWRKNTTDYRKLLFFFTPTRYRP